MSVSVSLGGSAVARPRPAATAVTAAGSHVTREVRKLFGCVNLP